MGTEDKEIPSTETSSTEPKSNLNDVPSFWGIDLEIGHKITLFSQLFFNCSVSENGNYINSQKQFQGRFEDGSQNRIVGRRPLNVFIQVSDFVLNRIKHINRIDKDEKDYRW